MLANARISAVVPVTNLDRARDFYEGLLGLDVLSEDLDQGAVTYESGGTYLLIYQRATPSSGDHTIAGFDVGDDFDDVVDQLMANNVTFDTFDVPGMDLPWDERGVLWDGTRASAWFKDPDGNVLVISKGMV